MTSEPRVRAQTSASQPTQAVVLGAGAAGVLAAAALTDVVDSVTVIERDRLPQGPEHRTGLPQARHAHLLWSGGVRAVDQLLPEAIASLIDRGAHRLRAPADMVLLTAHGWMPRTGDAQYAITCTRDLLDWTLRGHAQRHRQITIRDAADVVELVGNATRITGVRIQNRAGGRVEKLDADLVVDATGRGSHAKQWLATLGVPGIDRVHDEIIDSGLAYVTRIFEAPPSAVRDFPLVSVQMDVPTNGPGRAATLMPVEGGRWLVTLAGTRGHQPPHDETGFLSFARDAVRHPIVADLISPLKALTPVYSTHSTANRRLYFERLPRWPDGFVVLGDALATYNPIYGHGMSVAALNCLALRSGLRSHGLAPGSGRKLQRRVARTVEGAWSMATSIDVFYPNSGRTPPSRADRAGLSYMNRVIRAAIDDEPIAAAFINTVSLSAPPTRLARPRVLLATALPRRPLPPEALERSPLTDAELERAAAAG